MSLVWECPLCFTRVDRQLWKKPQAIHCHSTNKGYLHSPELTLKVTSLNRETIPALYRDHLPWSGARVVTLAGATRAGKTCWEYSLAGHTQYPEPGNPLLYTCFPASWGVQIDIAIAQSPDRNPVQMPIEKVFLEGVLPARTPEMRKALGYPIVFRRPRLLRKRSSILVIQDIAGESFRKRDPAELAQDRSAAHLRFSDDIVFLVDSAEVSSIYPEFSAFLTVINSVLTTRRERLNLRKVNFYLVLSQIDKANDALYQIAMTPPYRLPASRSEKDFQEYVAATKTVHQNLRAYVGQEAPRFQAALEKNFRHVYYCAISSLGCAPLRVENDTNLFEGMLPIQPEPLRAVDPLFWILQEDGFF